MLPLDDTQQEAVHAIVDDLRVIAGAGGGKTRVLTERAKYLRMRHTPVGGRVGVFTFTRDAGRELLDRLNQDMMIDAGTLHALGMKVLRAAGERHQVFTAAEQRTILGAINADHRLGYNLADDEEFERLCNAVSGMRRQFKAIGCAWIEDYTARLRSLGKIDLDDLILAPLLHCDAALAKYGRRFDHVLVDEAQDLTPAEWHFLETLVPNWATVTMVGDACQCIYSFRGANPDLFLSAPFRGRSVLTQTLGYNYRSGGALVELTDWIASRLCGHTRLTKAVRHGGLIRTCMRGMLDEAAAETVKVAVEHAGRCGGPVRILARTRREVRDLLVAQVAWARASDVTVGTMHAAKGQEWPTVVLHGLAGGTFPHPLGVPAEEARLFYVAASRAKNTLLVPVTFGPGWSGSYWSWLEAQGYGEDIDRASARHARAAGSGPAGLGHTSRGPDRGGNGAA